MEIRWKAEMKLCVFSDSHGAADKLVSAVARERPALLFFLGDGERDLAAVRERFPSLAYYAVRGNCDLRSDLSAELTCMVGGVAVFAAHGHRYNVKFEPGLESLTEAAREAGAKVALFGHTHEPCCVRHGGILCLNPGSIRNGDYAVLTIEGGNCTATRKRLRDGETILLH